MVCGVKSQIRHKETISFKTLNLFNEKIGFFCKRAKYKNKYPGSKSFVTCTDTDIFIFSGWLTVYF